MSKTIYIPSNRLSVLKEYTDPDEFTIGTEVPVGDNYAHVGKKKVLKESYGNEIDWDNVDSIKFTVDPNFDDDEELQEYMEEYEVSYDEAKLNRTYFDIGFYNRNGDYLGEISDTYEIALAPPYPEVEDDELLELILNTWKSNPEQKEYKISDIQFNKWYNCTDIYEAAKHLFDTADEYMQGMHGFVLQDGTIILMSPGSDHNEITALHGIETKWQFIEMGNPSILGNNLRVGGLLTYEQKEVIGRMIRTYSNGEIYVSFLGGPKGEQTCRYVQPDYRRVFADIERYYDEGIIPLGESVGEKEVLKEGLSPILYHYTGIWDLIDIFENGYIPLRYYDKDGMYELSTTRQLNSTIGYPSMHNNASMHKAEYDTCIVRLTLDGNKLQNNYKGKQYNHFPPYGDNPTEKAKAEINTPLNFIESEDRILSYDDTLPLNTNEGNDRGYIKRIEILIRPDNDINEIYNPYPSIADAFDDLLGLDVYAEVYFDENEFNKPQRRGESLSTAKYTLEEFMEELLPAEDEEEEYVEEGIIKENLEPEVEDNEVNLSSFKNQSELAPKIWKEGNILNSKVRMKLLRIADDFWDFVNISWVEPKTVLITGSICNFNWSKYSDIDLHIVVDFSEIDNRTDFVQEYFDTKKNEWNQTHDKLKLYGFPVELYVRDIDDTEESSGKYDLENNTWISKPNRDALHDINGSKYEIKHITAKIMTKIDDLSDALTATNDNDESYKIGEKAHKLFKKIKNMRKDGLARGGESDPLNIVYKCLRRTEYLDKLWKISSESYDKVNSIYETIKNCKNILTEEVVADGNAQHNVYSQRWKQEREDLKNFLMHYGKMMTSKENGKRYFVYYDKNMSSLVGNNYAVCLQYNLDTMQPSGTVYIRALDKFTERLFTPHFDTRGRDNIAGNGDDNLNSYQKQT